MLNALSRRRAVRGPRASARVPLLAAALATLAACAQGTIDDDAAARDAAAPSDRTVPGDGSTGGNGDSAAPDVTCAAGQTACGGRCVDTQGDPANCGACGTVCPAGQGCATGRCGAPCAAPRTQCSAGGAMACVDLSTDPANCGVCGMACATGLSCTAGRCGCAAGTTMCGAACVDTQTDRANCGACGTACPTDQMCVMGHCQINCPAPRSICVAAGMMSCVDLTSDVANCGACGTVCPARPNTTASCAMGACRSSCNSGFGDCNAMPADGCETTLATSVANCGACGTACPTRPNATAVCTGGACRSNCTAGFGDCNGNAADGCETAFANNDANCGACGRACATGTRCVGTTCTAVSLVIEDFETASWPRTPWVAAAGGTGTLSAGCAHDGATGISDVEWFYRTDVSVGAPGTTLSIWTRPGTGRMYMGFGASAAGAWSCVAAPNTNQLILMANAGYGYTDLFSAAQTYTAGQWYRLEASFAAGGVVTCRLYTGAAGTTLVNSVSGAVSGFAPGGVAIRSFLGFCSDTLSR